MAPPILDLSAATLVEHIKQEQYWDYNEKRFVKFGLITRLITRLFGNCLGWMDTLIQRCAFRTLEAIKREAVTETSPLSEHRLVQEWHTNTETHNSWHTLLSLATAKKGGLYRNQLSSLFIPTFDDTHLPPTQEHKKLFDTMASPLDSESQKNLEKFFIELMDRGKKNSAFFLPDQCKLEKIRFLTTYAWPLRHLITFTTYFPPQGKLIAHPLRILALCLLPGPILEAGLNLQRTRHELWDLFFPKLVDTLNWYDPALFADPRMVNGLLLTLNVDPLSPLFAKCTKLVREIEADRKIHTSETPTSGLLWHTLFLELINRPI